MENVKGDSRFQYASYNSQVDAQNGNVNTKIFIPVGAIIQRTFYIVTEKIDSLIAGGFTCAVYQNGVVLWSNGDTSTPVDPNTSVTYTAMRVSTGEELILTVNSEQPLLSGKFIFGIEYSVLKP